MSKVTVPCPNDASKKVNDSLYPLTTEDIQYVSLKPTKFGHVLKRILQCTSIATFVIVIAMISLTLYRAANMSTTNDIELTTTAAELQCNIIENNRFDCWPEKISATEDKCRNRGCCWKPASKPETAPYCFFPSNYDGYKVKVLNKTSSGYEGVLTRTTSTFFSPDVMELKLLVSYHTNNVLRIKLFDPNNIRYEVPMNLSASESKDKEFKPLYNVEIFRQPFNILVTRITTGEPVFETMGTAPLIFSDQYLQIATRLSSKYLYGLGEHRSRFLQDLSTWRRLVFWNRDAPPYTDKNGYGTHPFYVNLEPNGRNTSGPSSAHGVFLLNSNAGEVALQPFTDKDKEIGAITYRTLGGVLDLYVTLGPDPLAAVSQYVHLIGHSYMPPFWSLGFHLCKFGYQTGDVIKQVIERNRAAQMPYDVQWNDIDYMADHKDWTFDPQRYKNLPAIVEDLHKNKQRYVIMADPAIASFEPAGTYPPFDDGKQMDIFVKNRDGQILIGKVWPGLTAYPDFFHPNATSYWYKQAKSFHDLIPFDGLWIDMNEPSNFVDGSTQGCDQSKINFPPYVPPTLQGGSLMSKTICPSAQQYLSSHYDLHNMYGWGQANVSRRVLSMVLPGKRSPLITRSSFVGSGKFTGHWLGDNHSGFDEMFYSIPGILNFNLFGIPQIGADICGFGGTTTPELCVRWHQLGAFYPFMRNHADLRSPVQDPASFASPYRDNIRSALQLRYKLLAVLYNAFYDAHVNGNPIVRPLFFLYPGTEDIDSQFMWMDQLLISPVLKDQARTVFAFMPSDVWYDFYTGAVFSHVGQHVTLPAALDTINLHIRGGAILPLLPATVRTDISRQQKFELVIAPNVSGQARGYLFWDDGESSDSISAGKYSQVFFSFTSLKNELTSTVSRSGYRPENGLRLGVVTSLNVAHKPSTVLVNGRNTTFTYTDSTKVLTMSNLDWDLLKTLTVSWS